MGENEGGYIVTDADAEAKQKELEIQNEFLGKSKAIRFSDGIFGIICHNRLPSEIWNLMKPFATYHNGSDEDMEWAEDMGYYNPSRRDLKGWYYTSDAIQALLKSGYPINYKGGAVTEIEDLNKISERIDQADKAEEVEIEKIKNKAKELIQALENSPSETPTAKEIELIKDTERITLLSYRGADIYGGGRWLHINGNDLYLVINNGRDGDNWSLNNYPTGGAGAICIKKPGQAGRVKEINDWIDGLGADWIYVIF